MKFDYHNKQTFLKVFKTTKVLKPYKRTDFKI